MASTPCVSVGPIYYGTTAPPANNQGGSLSQAIVLNFLVLKGVAA